MEILVGFLIILSGISILLFIDSSKRLKNIYKDSLNRDKYSSSFFKDRKMVDGEWKYSVADGSDKNGNLIHWPLHEWITKKEKKHNKQKLLFTIIWVITVVLLTILLAE